MFFGLWMFFKRPRSRKRVAWTCAPRARRVILNTAEGVQAAFCLSTKISDAHAARSCELHLKKRSQKWLATIDPLGFVQKLHQLIFPQRRYRMAAVAAGFVAQGNHDGAPVRDAFNLALEDS